MYELIQLTENNYYIESPAKVGVVVVGENEVVLIDSGNDKDAGKKIKKVLDARGWHLKAIFNTHSHADHIGGNQYLQKQTGCEIYALGIEQAFTSYPILEPCFLYGGYPMKELQHKFLMAAPSDAGELTEAVLPQGMEVISLPGHSFHMAGFRTGEDVVYLADCLSSAETLEKYQLAFLVDVEAYLETLEAVKQMKAKWFVPSHAAATNDIRALAQLNIDKVREIGDKIVEMCREPRTFEDLLREVFVAYDLKMTFEQHGLIGSTLRSYLTWLKNAGRVEAVIEDNRMLWRAV